jgi:hypothetical protein
MNSARELKIATGVRVVGRDMSTVTFLAESEVQAQTLSRGSETCRGESEQFRTTGAACGEPSREPGGGTSLHLATCGRNLKPTRLAMIPPRRRITSL